MHKFGVVIPRHWRPVMGSGTDHGHADSMRFASIDAARPANSSVAGGAGRRPKPAAVNPGGWAARASAAARAARARGRLMSMPPRRGRAEAGRRGQLVGGLVADEGGVHAVADGQEPFEDDLGAERRMRRHLSSASPASRATTIGSARSSKSGSHSPERGPVPPPCARPAIAQVPACHAGSRPVSPSTRCSSGASAQGAWLPPGNRVFAAAAVKATATPPAWPSRSPSGASTQGTGAVSCLNTRPRRDRPADEMRAPRPACPSSAPVTVTDKTMRRA